LKEEAVSLFIFIMCADGYRYYKPTEGSDSKS